MKNVMKSLLICVSLVVVPAALPGATVFSNFGAGSSYNTALGNPIGNDFNGDNLAQGDTFVSGANFTFTSLNIALSCIFGGCPDPLSVKLTSDAAGKPGATIESFTVPGATLGALGNNNAPVVLNSIIMPTLVAGTRYWITVSTDLNDTAGWNLNSTGDTSSEALSPDGGSTWIAPSNQTPGAYAVFGNAPAVTPEPASMGLLLGSGILLGLLKRARKRQ